MLEQECNDAGVEIRTNSKVREVHKADAFAVGTESELVRAPCLVVATGGLSIPKIGATSFGYDVARQFNLKIQTPRPGLVPLVFSEADSKRWCDLAGVSTEVIASVSSRKQSFREKMLFTHRGISGPAILQISSYWDDQQHVSLDLAPERKLVAELRERGHRDGAGWKSLLRDVLPRRLADRWLEARPLSGNSDSAFAEAEIQIHDWRIIPAGTEGFGKAEVTAGGVDTDELSAKTMESRKVPGLFLIGEVVDVTGQLGGFNFQWAWASGFCAGQAL
jgi:predicted Rossmann fold flavoprotein